MKKFVLIALSITMLAMAGCSAGQQGGSSQSQISSAPQSSQADVPQIPENPDLYQYTDLQEGETIATIHTTLGDIKVRFFKDQAPKAVENFLGLAEQGYYDNNKIHRIVKDFIIQAGSLDGEGGGGKTIYNDEPFELETSFNLYHFYGALSMANSGGNNSNSSQFFIVCQNGLEDEVISQLEEGGWPKTAIEKYAEVGGTPALDQRYTVFGHVMEGMDVVEKIASQPVKDEENALGEKSTPAEDILITGIEVEEYHKEA